MSDHLEQSHRSVGIPTRFDRIFGNPSAWNHQPRNGDMNRIYHLGFLPKNKSVASLGLVHTVLKVEPEKISCRMTRMTGLKRSMDSMDDWNLSTSKASSFSRKQLCEGKTEASTTAEKPDDKWRTHDSPITLRFTFFNPHKTTWWSPEYWSNLKVILILLFLLQSPRIQKWRPAAQQSMRLKKHTTTKSRLAYFSPRNIWYNIDILLYNLISVNYVSLGCSWCPSILAVDLEEMVEASDI